MAFPAFRRIRLWARFRILLWPWGKSMLSEFPELCGVEHELINRYVDEKTADRFVQLMRAYAHAAEAVGLGFDMNSSPGHIKDGLITDAIKSAGAAKKGGTSRTTAGYLPCVSTSWPFSNLGLTVGVASTGMPPFAHVSESQFPGRRSAWGVRFSRCYGQTR